MPSAISLCSGGGGLDRAVKAAGFNITHMLEQNAFCCSVLRKNFPHTKVIQGDIRDDRQFPYADFVYGGPPCQGFSHSGNRLGFADERNLWPYAFRIVQQVQPRVVLVENVAGSLAEGRNLTDYVLSDLETEGYAGETYFFSANLFGAPQERYRAFIVAHRECDRHHRTTTLPYTNIHAKRHHSAPEQGRRSVAAALVTGGQTLGTNRRPPAHCVGRKVHGGARGLDRHQFPAGQGAFQFDHEPPRTVAEKDADYQEKMQLLGNLVIPQQAYPLAQAIHDWLVSHE